MVRFLHTADLQLGMPFHWVSGDSGAKLRELRFEAIDRIIDTAETEDAQFVLIAGDLFDANALDDRVVQQACVRFARARMPIFVIPGNHDHIGEPNAVLRRAVFLENKPSDLHVLETRDPISILDGAVVLLPAPIFKRVDREDPTRHFTAELGRSLGSEALRIGVAHGSVITIDPLASSAIDLERTKRAELDYLALGDWHGRKQVDGRTWYAGTPEPTHFKDTQTGEVLVVDVAGRGTEPTVKPIQVGQARWLRYDAPFTGRDDLDALEAWFEGIDDKPSSLVRLAVDGTLSFNDLRRLDGLYDRMGGQLLHLRVRGEVLAESSVEALQELEVEGYLRTTVERLAEQSRGSDDEAAALARRALRILYQLRSREHAC